MIAINTWDGLPELELKLWEAGMRYAVLVGIADPFEELAAHVHADIAKYGDMRHSTDGFPIFDDNDAAKFISEIAGVTKDVASEWISYDWAPPEDDAPEEPPKIVLH